MVRCSIKRSIKAVVFFSIFLFIIKTLVLSSYEINKEQKTSKILLISSHYSKNIQRLILFLNELRLSYEYHEKFDENLLHHNRPSMIITDHRPETYFHQLINQYQISLLIFFNDQCQNCRSIHSNEMLFENFTYPTINFHSKDEFQITSSPFRIQSFNQLIKLLRFNSNLPYFAKSSFQCTVLPHAKTSIIYLQTKQTFEKLDLLSIYSQNEIHLSECLAYYWFSWPLLMDIFRYLMSDRYDYHGLIRHIQIDIDDIFLGKKSSEQLQVSDIQALIRSQEFIRNYVSNFKYRLGFSGFYFDENDDADQLLMKEKDQFIWFHHTWKHEKLTHINDRISLMSSTKQNLDFAKKYKLPIDRNYAIAPHHSGIYPINPIVYDVWSRILNINVTSTENYPYHFDLSSNHRGFVYQNLSVLPRHSCGLFTTTRNYVNHSHRLERDLMGGRLFRKILTNPIVVFMSHNVNYGGEHLGNYVFSKLVYLISQWTTIQLSNDLSSSDLARKYFHELYPDEQMPIFTNPCDDEFLMNLWNGNRSMCRMFPKFIIVGPQKTGTTALHSMLSQHPYFYPSTKSQTTFEELQFFNNDKIYLNGIHWYLTQFSPETIDHSHAINFEKSATYFDSNPAIKRIKSLLPHVRLIMIFTEPGARAYSRYQHEIARTNQTITFDSLLNLNTEQTNEEYRHLRERCLQPGHYAEHLSKWLKYFSSKQIYIIDGEAFRHDPRLILDDLQISFLQLTNPVNSSKLVRFNKKKGFFCPVNSNNHTQCLGNSKGRRYVSMSSFAREYLNEYYLLSNRKLLKILQNKNYSIPLWLSDK